jgi:hypothetical protein
VFLPTSKRSYISLVNTQASELPPWDSNGGSLSSGAAAR